MLGYIEEYKKSFDIADLTVNTIISETNISSLLVSYYLKAIGAKKLNNHEDMKENLIKVFSLLRIENNDRRIAEYGDYISRNFHISESDIIEYK